MDDDQVYTFAEATQILRIGPTKGHALIKAGKLRKLDLGPGIIRITGAAIREVLESRGGDE